MEEKTAKAGKSTKEEKTIGITLGKQSNGTPAENESVQEKRIQDWHNAIKKICDLLASSTQSFDVNEVYRVIVEYLKKHKRWLYSDVSAYLFQCNDEAITSFLSNVDKLQAYAQQKLETGKAQEKEVATAIDKLWDHSNLAQNQNKSLHDDDKAFAARFDKNLIPFKASFAREMNMQFISLIAIFTALSFIVFGGISALDNIFSGVTKIPVLQLIIVGSIWGLCISNLVFLFVFFVSKLTKISIKTSENVNASIGERYPFIIWCNLVMLLILAVSCWLHYIDNANIGNWFSEFSKGHSAFVSVGGFVIIGIAFAAAYAFLFKKEKGK